jgi:Domain of unknown function (DUF6894)
VFSFKWSRIMPLYFFHLTFGDRVSLDAEGVELPSRCAACEEAMAVVSELSDPALGGNPRRWASWFLQVADEHGAFLRAPIGHPALQLVSEDQEPVRWQVRSGMMLDVRPNSLRDRTAQLLRRNRRLRYPAIVRISGMRENPGARLPAAPASSGRRDESQWDLSRRSEADAASSSGSRRAAGRALIGTFRDARNLVGKSSREIVGIDRRKCMT